MKKCQALTQVMCYDLHYVHVAIKDTVVANTHKPCELFYEQHR